MRQVWIAAVCVLAPLAGCRGEPVANFAQDVAAPKAPSGLDQVVLTVDGRGRSHRFTVEVARSEGEQAQGLMGRRSLGPDLGMLFPFDPPRPASFWMRNTLIPLDMLFIRTDGTIARIAANTVPLSEEPVGVEQEMSAVLELRGGRARELGIREGDRVSWTD